MLAPLLDIVQSLDMPYRIFMDEYHAVVRAFATQALVKFEGNCVKSAAALKMSRSTFVAWRKFLGISVRPDATGLVPPVEATISAEYKRLERLKILEQLEKHKYHRTTTARALRISRRTLQYKLRSYGIAENDNDASSMPLAHQ